MGIGQSSLPAEDVPWDVQSWHFYWRVPGRPPTSSVQEAQPALGPDAGKVAGFREGKSQLGLIR